MNLDNLLVDAKAGDQEAREKVVYALEPLIKSSIKKCCPIWSYYEDLYQDGIIIVLECIKNFDKDKANFLAYVKAYLRYYYLDTFKYLLKGENTISLAEKEELINLIEDDFNLEEDILMGEDNNKLWQAIDQLTPKQRYIIILFYYYEIPLQKIAVLLQISKWTVVNTKRRAIEKLRRYYDIKQIAN